MAVFPGLYSLGLEPLNFLVPSKNSSLKNHFLTTSTLVGRSVGRKLTFFIRQENTFCPACLATSLQGFNM